MAEGRLQDRHILVVEDEYLIATEICEALTAAGAKIVGPASTVRDAVALVTSGTRMDGAVLDVNLRGTMVFPVADELRARGVPFIFATGYDETSIPERFLDATQFEKPLDITRLADAIVPMLRR